MAENKKEESSENKGFKPNEIIKRIKENGSKGSTPKVLRPGRCGGCDLIIDRHRRNRLM